jgi:deoxyribose-phosphate aldolase
MTNEINLARAIDHTLLKPDATKAQVEILCHEARTHNFATVCINPLWVKTAAKLLAGTQTGVCTVIGFPLGAATTAAKVSEAKIAIDDGATELDMVLSIGQLKAKQDDAVYEDIKAIVAVAAGKTVKVIFETCLLSDEEIIRACQLATKAGVHFVKTSTGFSTGGATPHHVSLMRANVPDSIQVKASGGIRTREQALEYLELGATRLGTSAGVALVAGQVSTSNY